jgi:phosphosulfolactate synthase
VLDDATRILGALGEDGLGHTAVLDLSMGPAATEDFVDLARHILTEWKLCATTWLLADRRALLRKIEALRAADVTVIAGGTAGEIAAARGTWSDYVELCTGLGISRVEIAEGFLTGADDPASLVEAALDSELEIQYEIGRKNMDEDRELSNEDRVEIALKWAELGVEYFVLEAREVGGGYALFPDGGTMNLDLVHALMEHFPLRRLVFEAPTRAEYCPVLRALGPEVCVSNIPPGELFRVEMMRRAIHADTIDLRGSWVREREDGRAEVR